MKNAGLYIHIPFCIKKCPYCTFYSHTDLSLEDIFIYALEKEIEKKSSSPFVFDTIYFGGGTPSVLKTKNIEKIINKIFKCFKIKKNCDITIETNPKTINQDSFFDYKKIGINKISIGVQSFDDNNLKTLGRIHCSLDAKNAIKFAEKAKFENIGIDIIYSILKQNKENLLNDLKTAISFSSINHISCYLLSYEKGSQFYIKKKEANEEKKEFLLFDTTINFLEKYGFFQYEISNFAKIGAKSKHNQKYWNFMPYLGLGPSAHSYDKKKRYWNISNIKEYIEKSKTGASLIEQSENLSENQKKIEAIYLGFRQKKGIDINLFNENFDANFIKDYRQTINFAKKENILNLNKKHCFLTTKGLFMLDAIVAKFL